SSQQLEIEAHTGPIIYIAKALDKGIDEAVLWMILLIIFVFDPLAIALTIGANIALTKRHLLKKETAPTGDHPPPPTKATESDNTVSTEVEDEINRVQQEKQSLANTIEELHKQVALKDDMVFTLMNENAAHEEAIRDNVAE